MSGEAAGEDYVLYSDVLYDEDYDPDGLFRGSDGLPVWAAELSSDATTVAVGSDDIDDGAPVTVLDIETEDIYTIDVFGQLL